MDEVNDVTEKKGAVLSYIKSLELDMEIPILLLRKKLIFHFLSNQTLTTLFTRRES